MQKIFIVSIFIYTAFCACNNRCDSDVETYTFQADKAIEITSDTTSMFDFHTISNGDMIVFIYWHMAPDCRDIDDDEYGEELIFQIPKNLTEFQFTNDELVEAQCRYREFGAWAIPYTAPITEGTLSGRKTSDESWEIEVSVQIIKQLGRIPDRIEFETTFHEAE